MSDRVKVLDTFYKQKEATEKRVAEGIEKYRKGDIKIVITDENGVAVPMARVSVSQKKHRFKFGANLFMLEELESEEKNQKYKQYFKDIFNIATLPFYWKDLEPTPGKRRFEKDSERIYRRPAIDLCMEYCEENGIEPREHCLNYETWIPDWLLGEPLATIKEKLEERFGILAERYSDRIPCWEVTNETLFPHYGRKLSAFYNEKDFVEWSFRTAEKYFKNNELTINEAHCNVWANAFNYDRSAYYMQIERALRAGARIDAIGMQFHMFFDKEAEAKETELFYDPSHLFKVLDTYSEFDRPLQITEITIPAYSMSEEDERIQADILEELYSIWFSHPATEQIIYWNLVDGYAAFAPQGDMTAGENYYHGGLLRFDLSPKPAYLRLKELIHKKWHTKEELITDGEGSCSLRGFFGQYEITVNHNGKDVKAPVDFAPEGSGEIRLTV